MLVQGCSCQCWHGEWNTGEQGHGAPTWRVTQCYQSAAAAAVTAAEYSDGSGSYATTASQALHSIASACSWGMRHAWKNSIEAAFLYFIQW